MKIAILGMGCATCNKLEDTVRLAVKEAGIDAQIDHVKDIKQIMAYGVMTTPALVIDGKSCSRQVNFHLRQILNK